MAESDGKAVAVHREEPPPATPAIAKDPADGRRSHACVSEVRACIVVCIIFCVLLPLSAVVSVFGIHLLHAEGAGQHVQADAVGGLVPPNCGVGTEAEKEAKKHASSAELSAVSAFVLIAGDQHAGRSRHRHCEQLTAMARGSGAHLVTDSSALEVRSSPSHGVSQTASSSLLATSTFTCSETNRALCHLGDTANNQNCSRSQPRCDWDLFWNKLDGPYVPCCEKRHLFDLFVWFRNLIDANKYSNPDFWYSPSHGTLLASQRDNDLINYDTDIDIVVPYEHVCWLDRLIRQQVGSVDPPYGWSGSGETNSRLYASAENEVHIDIWYAHGSQPLNGSRPERFSIKDDNYPFYDEVLTSWFFPLQDKRCCLQQECFSCPRNPEALLDHWFPTGWRKPGILKSVSFPVPGGPWARIMKLWNEVEEVLRR